MPFVGATRPSRGFRQCSEEHVDAREERIGIAGSPSQLQRIMRGIFRFVLRRGNSNSLEWYEA